MCLPALGANCPPALATQAGAVDELFTMLDELGYDSYLLDETCGRPADCRNLINLPRGRAFPWGNRSALSRAIEARRLWRVDAQAVRRVLPCCARGGACCRPTHSAGTSLASLTSRHLSVTYDKCCRSDRVREYLASERRRKGKRQ